MENAVDRIVMLKRTMLNILYVYESINTFADDVLIY